jgi:hypothetical protein
MKCTWIAASLAAVLSLASASFAAPIYVEDFDVDPTASWTVNNNGSGTNAANFFFDYSTVGIPSAPNSTGGSTRGLKLQANISGVTAAGPALPGISVSPTGKSFTGDYELKFDWWHNWLGGTFTAPSTGGIGASAGGSGSTQLSTFGILSSGTTANYAGASDGVFYAATGDGASASDYRVYSSEKPTSYALADAHNTYAAGSLNNTAALYTGLFPAGATAPAAQIGISSTQNGSTLAGTAGFRWHQVSIKKAGNIVTWSVNGTVIATTDTTNFTTATSGSNILFGHSDTSLGAGTPAAIFAQLDFSLIDNVRVVPEPSSLVLGLCMALGFVGARRR